MRAHLRRRVAWIVPAVASFIAALGCHDTDHVVGVSGEQAPQASKVTQVRQEEQRAVELSRTIRGFAGFYYDTSGHVIVAVKDVDNAGATRSKLQPLFLEELGRSRVRHPNADVFVSDAQYLFMELRTWRDRFLARDVLSFPGVVWLDLDEAANRIVVGLETGADASNVRALALDAGVPLAAVEFEATKPYVSHTTLRDQFRPIQGGVQIQRVVGTTRATCTLGFTALWSNQPVFLTAGHCSPNVMGTDDVAQYQPVAPLTPAESATTSAIGRELFRYSEVCGNRRCASSDAAIYGFIPLQTWQLGRIARPTIGCFPGPCSPLNLTVNGSWVVDTTRTGFVVNDLVNKIGSSTGWSQGLVTRTCVDVTPTQGVTYRCQMFASYGADDGDSGSPIVLEIQGGSDSTVSLGGIHSGRSGNNQVFSPWSGIVQDYGSLVVVPLEADTAWMFLTDRMPQFDTAKVATLPGDTLRVFRTDVSLTFRQNVTDADKRAFFASHSMTHIQVTPTGRFFVRVPDRGLSADSILQTIASLRNEPEVARAGWVLRSEPRVELSYRFPIDGPGLGRADWVPTAPTSLNTWAMRAVRAPLAWGCETGDYDNTPVRLGILEYKHQSMHPEFLRSSPQLWEPPDGPGLIAFASPQPQSVVQTRETHAIATSGLLAAEGNNNSGVAGLNWRSDLYPYNAYSPANRMLPFVTGLFVLTTQLQVDAPRVLSVSIDQTLPPMRPNAPQDTIEREGHINDTVGEISALLRQTPGMLLVIAAGNDRYRGTVADYFREPTPALLRLAVLRIRQDSAQYRDRIIVVAGTAIGNNFWDVSAHSATEGSNFFAGMMDIAAPAEDVRVLDRWTGQTGTAVPTVFSTGTSLSAPMVAGVAGLLLAMDPSLTAEQVKDYIVWGARRPRADEQTGQLAVPPAVSGAPETIYQLDAYGSLTLMAAERQSIPVCGNRAWVQNNQVIAERELGTPTAEPLFNLTEPRSFVNVRHGGRRVEVSDDTSDRAIEFVQDHWVSTQNAPTTARGGTHASMEAWSHDLDTLVRDRFWTSADTAFFEYTANTFNPFTQRIIDTLQLTLARFTGGECVRRESDGDCNLGMPSVGTEEGVIQKYAYAPIGNRLLVAVNYLVTRWLSFSGWSNCPIPDPSADQTTCRNTTYQQVSERSEIWAVDLTTGAETARWTVPGQVYWLGVSDDGGQVVAGEGVLTTVWTWQPRLSGEGFEQVWSNPGTVTDCSVHYRSLATGAELRPRIVTSAGCTSSTRGNGTIAPAPPISGGWLR